MLLPVVETEQILGEKFNKKARVRFRTRAFLVFYDTNRLMPEATTGRLRRC